MRVIVCVLVVATSLLATACVGKMDVWSGKDSTAQHLVIRVAKSKRSPKPLSLSYIEVRSCDSNTVFWSVYAEDAVAAGPPITSIGYGAALTGLKVSEGPKPLTVPGCYIVTAHAVGSNGLSLRGYLYLQVADDGAVKDLKYEEAMKLVNAAQSGA